jgi:hypothetical protein
LGRRGRRPRRPEPQVGVVGQLRGPAAGALGQVALGQGLDPPGDALDEPDLVAGGRLFAEDLGVPLPQFSHGHPLQGGDLFSDVQVHAALLSPSSRKPSTSVDAEHGFRRNLKAIWAGFRQLFRASLTLSLSHWERAKGEGVGRERRASAEAQQAGGEDGRDLAQPLVGGHAGGIGSGRMGHLLARWAHSDLRKAAGRLSGGKRTEASTYRPLQVALEMTHRGPRGTGPVTPRGVVTRESESFGARFRGARGTFKVALGLRVCSLEIESAVAVAGLAEVLAGKAENAKRREGLLSALLGNADAASTATGTATGTDAAG